MKNRGEGMYMDGNRFNENYWIVTLIEWGNKVISKKFFLSFEAPKIF